jgi:hypothetical protein
MWLPQLWVRAVLSSVIQSRLARRESVDNSEQHVAWIYSQARYQQREIRSHADKGLHGAVAPATESPQQRFPVASFKHILEPTVGRETTLPPVCTSLPSVARSSSGHFPQNCLTTQHFLSLAHLTLHNTRTEIVGGEETVGLEAWCRRTLSDITSTQDPPPPCSCYPIRRRSKYSPQTPIRARQSPRSARRRSISTVRPSKASELLHAMSTPICERSKQMRLLGAEHYSGGGGAPVVQPLRSFPALYGTRRFITAFTRALHWSLFWARTIQSTLFHPMSTSSILMLYTHLRLVLPSGLFPYGFPTSTL